MILCDIGNTNYHFFYKNQDLKIPIHKKPQLNEFSPKELNCIFYISVNAEAEQMLNKYNPCVNLAQYIGLESDYDLDELGVDRAFACLSLDDGVIIDAGSAITIDLVEGGKHKGGYIFPGMQAYQKALSGASRVLDKPLNFGTDLSVLPTNTIDAMSAGFIQSITLLVQSIAKDKKIYITGGDGKFFSVVLQNSLYDKFLIFRGMQKIVETNKLLDK